MRLAIRFTLLLAIVFGAHGRIRATEYCPVGYMGYVNGSYMYYCDYCSAGTCGKMAVSVGAMYTCGGDVDCCQAGATCIDPIQQSAIKPAGDHPGKTDVSTAAEPKPAAPVPAAAEASEELAPAAVAAPPRITMLIGETRQKKYVTASERFIVPGDQVTVHLEAMVQVREPDDAKSYFRLFKMSYAGKDPRHQGTVCFGMEMDPEKPPMNPASAVRAKKGRGAVYKHAVRFNHENYDVSSVRVLPDAP